MYSKGKLRHHKTWIETLVDVGVRAVQEIHGPEFMRSDAETRLCRTSAWRYKSTEREEETLNVTLKVL